MLQANVVTSRRVSPSIVRVTLGGPELARYPSLGLDQWFRLLVPRPGQEGLRLPPSVSLVGYARYLAMPTSSRPLLRNYTVRALRPEVHELDIDFVVHGESDDETVTAAAWAQRCEAGGPVGLLDEGTMYAPPPGTDWSLIAADESGMPAALGVLASLARDEPGARGLALIEVPTAEDVQPVDAPPGFDVRWLVRDDAHAVPGRLALATLQEVAYPSGRPYAFVVGESGLPVGARRHLVADRGVPKTDITFSGYWKHGARPNR